MWSGIAHTRFCKPNFSDALQYHQDFHLKIVGELDTKNEFNYKKALTTPKDQYNIAQHVQHIQAKTLFSKCFIDNLVKL